LLKIISFEIIGIRNSFLGGHKMTFSDFGLSILASIIATFLIGGAITYKIVIKNNKKSIKQKGHTNTAFMDSSINNDTKTENKGEK
jgi:hypothetical protein